MTQATTYDTIELTISGPVAQLTLARPDKMNCLSDRLLEEMQHALDAIERDRSVRVAIITGRGRAFCAGFDISPREQPFTTVQDWRDHVKLGNDTWWKIWRSRIPFIAAVNGYALGGGCDLSMVCDYTIAADTAQFGEPEIQFQSSPPFNIAPWLLGMKQAKEFLLFGDRVGAAEGQRLGLVNRVVPAAELPAAAMQTALRIARLPPPGVELNKHGLNKAYEIRGFAATIEFGAEIFTQILMSDSAEAREFAERSARDGLAAAFRWRDEKYADTSKLPPTSGSRPLSKITE